MRNYKITNWHEQNETFWGRITRPLRRWVMTPEWKHDDKDSVWLNFFTKDGK